MLNVDVCHSHSFFIVHFLKINFHVQGFILTVIELMKMTKQLIHFYQLFLRRQTFFYIDFGERCYVTIVTCCLTIFKKYNINQLDRAYNI